MNILLQKYREITCMETDSFFVKSKAGLANVVNKLAQSLLCD